MKALIFAAGLGTRLAPITNSIPKALVEVAGLTALEHTIRKISEAGIKDIIVNVHHFSEKIYAFLEDKKYFGLKINVSDESDRLLDTGGGLLRAVSHFSINEPVLMHNADIMTDNLPLKDLIDSFDPACCDASLLAWERDSSRRLLFDTGGIMRGWKNMTTGDLRPKSLDDEGLIALSFGGIHIVSPSIFPALDRYSSINGEVFSITNFYIAECSEFRFKAYTPEQNFGWWDIGRPETLDLARRHFEELKK